MKKSIFRRIALVIFSLFCLSLFVLSIKSYSGFCLVCKRGMDYEGYQQESSDARIFLEYISDVGFDPIDKKDVSPRLLEKYQKIFAISGDNITEWYLFKNKGHYLYIYYEYSSMPPYRLCLYKFYFAKGIYAIEDRPEDIQTIDNKIRETFPGLKDIHNRV